MMGNTKVAKYFQGYCQGFRFVLFEIDISNAYVHLIFRNLVNTYLRQINTYTSFYIMQY